TNDYRAEGWKALELRLALQAAAGGPEMPILFTCEGVEMSASNGDKWFEVEGPMQLREALNGVAIESTPGPRGRKSLAPGQLATAAYFAADEIELDDE